MDKSDDPRSAAAQFADAIHRLMPFHFFYEKAGRPLPDFTFLTGAEMPYPYRSMLVHQNDMTPTLAAFHHSQLYLEVHEVQQTASYLIRLVTLHKVTDDQPVEFGAIGINLDGFPTPVRDLIVEGKIPLGGILGEYRGRGVDYTGSPTAFFSVPADDLIAKALKQPRSERLFGRCNQLLDREGMILADIVEILPRHSESEKWIENVNSGS